MKNHDDFMQAVYAKADVRRKQIKRRNTMIRNATVSFVCTFVVALAVVPISRMFMEQQPTIAPEPVGYYNGLQGLEPRMGLIDPIPSGGEELAIPQAARMMVVENNQVALHNMDEMPEVVDVLAANYLPIGDTIEGDPISLPVVPRFNGEVIIYSVDGLLEFLAGLPVNIHLLDQLMAEYDDVFFSENVLKAMPIGIGVPTTTTTTAPDYTEVQREDEPTRDARSMAEYWHANVDSDVMLLLLMPVSMITVAE
ncbi:MAG: hypothetical protein FWE40_06820 [Oscillospiraceae bacterium]|nr:hypothetical protein [Oscillospiraceae bacterium]